MQVTKDKIEEESSKQKMTDGFKLCVQQPI